MTGMSKIGWRQHPVGVQKSSRFRGAKLHWI